MVKKYPIENASNSNTLLGSIEQSISLSMVKKHLRVQHDLDDEYIQLLMQNAYSIAVQYTGTSFISGIKFFQTDTLYQFIKIYDPNASAIISISYKNPEGNVQFIDLDNVIITPQIDLQGEFLQVEIPEVPVVLNEADSVRVTYQSGELQVGETLPGAVCQAILLMIGEFYEYREDRVWELTKASERLLNPFKSY